MTRGRQMRVLFDTRVPRPPEKEKLARVTKYLLSRHRKILYREVPTSHMYGEPRYGRPYGSQLGGLIESGWAGSSLGVFQGERGRRGDIDKGKDR